MPKRVLTPLEVNHLKKHGFSDTDPGLGEKPVEYLTGQAEFCGLDFLVNESTLIPRLESEKIVRLAEQFIAIHDLTHPTIADVGTGSGCLGLSLAVSLQSKQIPYTIYLSDISSKALAVAKNNASGLLPSTVNLFFEQSSLLDNFPKIKFDVLMANLPYIPSKNISTLDTSVKDFEPLIALDGGPQGTSLINQFIKTLPAFLSDLGLAIIEIDDTHTLKDFTIPKLFSAKIEPDLFRVPRFLVISPKLRK